MITSLPPGFRTRGLFKQVPQIVQFTVYEDSGELEKFLRGMNPVMFLDPVSLTGPRLISLQRAASVVCTGRDRTMALIGDLLSHHL
jgi:hypothetical protein